MLAQFGLSDKERNKEFGLVSNISKEDRKRMLEKQEKDNKWFVDRLICLLGERMDRNLIDKFF